MDIAINLISLYSSIDEIEKKLLSISFQDISECVNF